MSQKHPSKRSTSVSRIAEIRRQDLIQAAINCIAKVGYGDVTVQTICHAAGVSRGLIGHYFKGKDELLLEAVRQVTAELGNATKLAAQDAGDSPLAKLHALIDASFSPPGFTAEKVAVWTALASNAHWSPDLALLYKELWRDYRHAVAHLVERAAQASTHKVNPERVALTFSTLIEGLWIGWLADPESVTREAAKEACRDYLDAVLRS
tara:strand:+ start:128137 stop:128760 length:624 start_codon:yes stop_codon:yes gene_type:complete